MVKDNYGAPSQRGRAGSTASQGSGIAAKRQKYPGLTWSQVEKDVEHVSDFAATFSQSQVGGGGNLTVTMHIPVEYLHEVLDAHVASKAGMVYLRLYTVPVSLFEEADVWSEEELD